MTDPTPEERALRERLLGAIYEPIVAATYIEAYRDGSFDLKDLKTIALWAEAEIRAATEAERERLGTLLGEVLSCWPDTCVIEALLSDDPECERPMALRDDPTDKQILRWRAAIRGEPEND